MTGLNKTGMRVTYHYRSANNTVTSHELVFNTGDPEKFAQQLHVQMNSDRTLLIPFDNNDASRGFMVLPVTSIVHVAVEPD